MNFYKYHGIGNDYIVLNPGGYDRPLSENDIKRLCHRNFGIGSDGILWGPVSPSDSSADFKLRIFNPDGTEAEKSGNGLRIFARYLWDTSQVSAAPFRLETLGGIVTAQVLDGGRSVTVEMGQVSFLSDEIPITGPPREVIQEEIQVSDRVLQYCGATIGNPHCVVLCESPSEDLARALGPLIETDSRFPHRTNVQFMQVLNRDNIRIEIWERGAGYTLASGSSSSAAAAVAHRLGLCGPQITVHMPGGKIAISIGPNFCVTMTGPVTRVAEGKLFDELFA